MLPLPRRIRAAYSLAALIALAPAARADDWPQWRGPQRDGVWRETGIVEKFASPTLTPVWTAAVGPGYSGPTVVGDRVYLMDRVKEPEQQERVLCFDRRTGQPLWTRAYACTYRDIDYALGPRSSVTVIDGRAFAYGAMGHAHALDAATGQVLWARDLATEYKAKINTWAVTGAPLVVGDLVIFQAGGPPDACVVALDVKTGRERWRALDGPASYSAPRLVRLGDREVVLAWTAFWIAALDPATGKVWWKEPYKPANMILNVGDPVLDETGTKLFLSAFYDGARLYALPRDTSPPTLLWQRKGVNERKTDALHSIIMTPFIRGGHIYGIDSYGEMRCLDLATGDRVWEDTTLLANGRWATAYFVQHGDRTWITTEKGEIVIARLTPAGFERISSAQFIAPETPLRNRTHPIAWAHPAYAHRSLFARNDSTLVCISLAAPAP
jgi:outer membrane protein assembly factor BamB